MNLNDVRSRVKNIKIMLQDMIDAGELSAGQAEIIAPVIVQTVIKAEWIENVYTPDV